MLKIYNTLTRRIEEFQPIDPNDVRMYTCGPTVYDYQHIGNLRTVTLMDLLRRVIKANKYNIYSVMNVTDVDDKIENRAKETGESVDAITKKYEDAYMNHLKLMNVSVDVFPRATEHIKEQIVLVQELLDKGYAYTTDYGVYFDVTKDPDYGKLGNTYKSDKERSRIELTEGKRNPEDFALWKFPIEGEQRKKLWDSPWGKGFPGWHIECSAMSMKHLTKAFKNSGVDVGSFETIDIHLGGEDLKEVHHENEVAQSESITDKPFVKYWVHGAMLNVDEDKMSKSLNNFITLETVMEKGYDPMALRYFYYTAHYRKSLNFTWEALSAAQSALERLSTHIEGWQNNNERVGGEYKEYSKGFLRELNDDLNVPNALAVLWEAVKDESLGAKGRAEFLAESFEILGLKPLRIRQEEIPEEVKKLAKERLRLREAKDFESADKLRQRIEEMGYEIRDEGEEYEIRMKI